MYGAAQFLNAGVEVMWQVHRLKLKKQVQAICTKADKSRIISHADADISFYADADIFSHAEC